MMAEVSGYSELTSEDIRVIVIFLSVLLFNIFLYRAFKRAYSKIPDKTVEAHLLKARDYAMSSSSEFLDDQVSYTVLKYEYYINRKRHIIKFKSPDPYTIDDKKILYYKIGSFDIRSGKRFELPDILKVFWGIYFSIGTVLISNLVYKAIFGVWFGGM